MDNSLSGIEWIYNCYEMQDLFITTGAFEILQM